MDNPLLYVTCAEGLEELLEEELLNHGILGISKGYRGVYVPFNSLETVYKINYCSRVASRVLLPLKKFACFHRKDLYTHAKEIDWSRYIPRGKTLAIDANVTHPQLTNSLFAAQVVKDAICDQLREIRGDRPSIETRNPDIQINLFIRDKVAVISFDTSGAPLHKRGYRKESVEAPLQETLAASLLLLAKFTGQEILCDPCCGSGTILIEAALLATQTAPGYLRKNWGFMSLPDFSQESWLKLKGEEDKKRVGLPLNRFFGCDKNSEAIAAAKVNMRAAGFSQEIQVKESSFQEFIPSIPPNFIISNPPHGKRLEDTQTLRPLYRALGDFMKGQAAKPGRGFVFTTNLELAKEIGLAPKQRIVLSSGGIEGRFLTFDLY